MSGVNLRYVASSGRAYNLKDRTLRARSKTNFHKWEWGINSVSLQYGNRVSAFTRQATVYEAELSLFGTSESRLKRLEELHNDFELDVRNMTPGRLYWNDYYINCYATKSSTEPDDSNVVVNNTVSFYCPHPFWIKEDKIVLSASEVSGGGFLDFEYDFPYDFTAPVMGERNVASGFPFASEFRMVIYGAAVNPRITINDYPYVLYTTIAQGSYAVIDSKTKTVMLYGAGGVKTNIFDFRNKSDSIFEKIPPGNLNIAWDASFGVDLTIFRERSEPGFEEV